MGDYNPMTDAPGWEPDANGRLMPNDALMRLQDRQWAERAFRRSTDPRNGPCTVPRCWCRTQPLTDNASLNGHG